MNVIEHVLKSIIFFIYIITYYNYSFDLRPKSNNMPNTTIGVEIL